MCCVLLSASYSRDTAAKVSAIKPTHTDFAFCFARGHDSWTFVFKMMETASLLCCVTLKWLFSLVSEQADDTRTVFYLTLLCHNVYDALVYDKNTIFICAILLCFCTDVCNSYV